MDRLKNRVSIITGAGQGVGKAIAEFFAREGSKVVVAEINPVTGQEVAKLINSNGGDAIFVKTDISKTTDVQEMVKRTVEKYGKITDLVNNAAIMESVPVQAPLIQDLAEESWDQFMNIDLKGVFLCCKYTVPELIKAGGGSIINVSSMNANVKSPAYAYAASKGGMNAFTRSLALQLSEFNIRANILSLGYIVTPGITAIRAARKVKYNSENAQFKVNLVNRLIKRDGTPEDAAYAAVFLASDEAGYITGITFDVDGGALR
jgi:NAD(P)-dependent dehydrogenase (short-subunit alcohol dehydrogenase family)